MLQAVEVDPPGAHARRRPTKEQRQDVQAVLREHAQQLYKLERSQLRALAPVLAQAEAELRRDLKDWIHVAENGRLRWTAWKYRGAILQLRAMNAALEHSMLGIMKSGGEKAQEMALRHMVDEVARFSKVFGGAPPPLQLNLARIVAEAKSPLVARYRSSAERYVWGRKNGVWQDLNRRLAVDILSGAPVSKMIDRMQAAGGPRGLVAVRGVAGEEGAVVELIPEGLFARYRWRAAMFVRTELANAYSVQMLEGLFAARNVLPDLQKRWADDGSGCKAICNPADGQVVDLDDVFVLGDGSTTENPPGHPNCRCRAGAWRAHWGELFDSLGIH